MTFRIRILRILVVPALVVMVIGPALSGERVERKRTLERPRTDRVSRYDVPDPIDFESVQIPPSVFERRSSSVQVVGAQSSPGIEICGYALGGTQWDVQAFDNNQRMIALTGASDDPYVYFVWNYWDRIPDSLDAVDRFIAINCWSQDGGLGLGNCGYTLSPPGDPVRAFAGFPTIDVASDGKPHVAFEARNQISQPVRGAFSTFIANADTQCGNEFQYEELSESYDTEASWPHLAIDRNAGAVRESSDDVYHVCAHPTGDGPVQSFGNEIIYWRRVGALGSTWEGPVVLDYNAGTLNHHVAVDPTSDEIAVFYQRDNLDPEGLLQNGYLTSPDNGANWIAAGAGIFPTPIEPLVGPYVSFTNYSGVVNEDPQSWLEVQGEYDNDGWKHAVWIEQIYSNATPDCRVKHWTENGDITRTIKQALAWDNLGGHGARDLWLALPNIAFGDGSTICTDGPGDQTNRNYVYVTYEQYGGPTVAEQNDISSSDDMQNLEIHLSVSNDGGNTFSPSVNLTNTKTPGCDGLVPGSECASERDPSLAKLVNDTIHILYLLDTDAGDATFGQGNWTFNPVMYYRIPGGTDAEFLCPEIAPVFSAVLTSQDPDCEYHAALNAGAGMQQQVEELIIENFGNGTLSGTINENPVVDWLVLTTGAYSVLPGSPVDIRTVTMDASMASIQSGGEGLYQSAIEISHNDTTQAIPLTIPVDFFVFDEFYCPEFVTLNTGWLWLEMSNVERQGNRSQEDGGLSRLATDTSYSIYDASLVIAVPPSPDTLVFRNIIGEGNGQPGFRALGPLEIDTSAYGTNAGRATASARQTTVDSTIGIDVEYIFPQDPDSCEFVLIKYSISNCTADTLHDLIIGQATDFDVVPSVREADSIYQPGTQNTGHVREDFNLIYQQGVDSIGHVIVGDRTATRFKGGITAIQTFAAPRAWIAPNDPWLLARPGEGFHEGYLYDEMTEIGFELFPPNDPDPEEDLHAVMVMEQDVDLGPDDERRYIVGYVSSNTGTDDADLIATTRKAWRYCFGWNVFTIYDSMPNPATPTSYPYHAIGTHEDGIAGGCSGCIVTEIDDPENAFAIVPGSNPCYGTIEFTGTIDDMVYDATFRVTDLCSDYSDDISIEVVVGEPVRCQCPYQGDIDADGFRDAVDLQMLINILFFNAVEPQDPLCPITRSDLNGDDFSDSVDLSLLISHLFFNGPYPCDPCAPFDVNCVW
ncbi:MAG: hypothetical protein GF341_02420 [candidate division Zixibacteria bacterium]|nr:hypothetical protein [candidate division Zixibacteria bacterium]